MRGLIIMVVSLTFYVSQLSANCLKGNCKLGYGTYLFRDGSKYSGQFKNGIPNGKGRLVMKKGDLYEGSFQKGKKHGEGKYIFVSGNKYIGQFFRDKICGKGKMEYANNDLYKGQWKDNKPHGEGTYVYKDGREVKGQWKNGNLVKKLGSLSNTRINNTSSSYKNCNEKYCHEESGRFTYGDGSYFIGEFISGEPQGLGTCYYINGDVYKGGWKNHGPEGQGVISFVSGKKYSAIWQDGHPVKQVFNQQITDASEPNPKKSVGDGVTDMYALVIGISSYNHMPALKYTDDDAYQLFAFLKSPEGGALPEDHITILVDEMATKDNIKKNMKKVFRKADNDDVVIMYYSGHGLQGRFLPIDYDGYNNSLSHQEIYDLIDNSAAKKKLLIADACYSGSMSSEKGSFYNSLDNFYRKLHNADEGTAVIMSSKAEEKSLEYSGFRQGVFSHFLMKGLKGQADKNMDAIVSISELYNYISHNVKSYTDNRQSPTISGIYDDNMPVSMIRR